jgi:hypothetical protein
LVDLIQRKRLRRRRESWSRIHHSIYLKPFF